MRANQPVGVTVIETLEESPDCSCSTTIKHTTYKYTTDSTIQW